MAAAIAEKSLRLVTGNAADQVALRALRLVSRVKGLCARSTLEQTFVNLEGKAIEAVYTFPLPDGAAVCGFEVIFFDHIFTGVVEETDKAIEKYDDAMAAGHGAYLLEQHRPDVFTVRVGNLKPRQAVTIRLTWVQDVQIVEKQIRLAFPTTVSPRYTTDTGTNAIDAAIDGDALNPPHVLSVPYGLSFEIEIDGGLGVEKISSPSHAIEVKEGSRVTCRAGVTAADRDIVVLLDLAAEQTPFALAATAGGENFVALNFLPEFEHEDLETGPTTTFFLLDCSGSMEGESIAQAAAALECCLRAMNEGDVFNVCRFGSTYELLAPEPLTYNKKTLQAALGFVRQGANLGGTELMPALEHLLNTPSSLIANIVLLTDGQVSNEPAILALAKRKRARNRIFTFGIGHGASHFLVNGLARVTGGAAEFITPGERIEDKVLRTFGRLASPPVTDVEIDFHTTDAEVAPRTVPPIFDGDGLRVFARIPGRKLPERVTLRCKTPGGPREWTVDVRRGADGENVLPTLWARAAIAEIEDGDAAGVHSALVADSPEKKRLVALSKQYNLVCSQTAFIALEHRSIEDRTSGQPALRRVPVQLTKDWGGVDVGTGLAACAMSAPVACAPPAPPADLLDEMMNDVMGGAGLMRGFAGGSAPGLFKSIARKLRAGSAPKPAQAAGGSSDRLIALLSLQDADGHFRDDSLVSQFLPDRKVLEGRLRKQFTSPDQITTLLVLHILESQFKDRQSTWKRAAKKARAWLAKSFDKGVIDAALALLG